jgi:hypothetical protein
MGGCHCPGIESDWGALRADLKLPVEILNKRSWGKHGSGYGRGFFATWVMDEIVKRKKE